MERIEVYKLRRTAACLLRSKRQLHLSWQRLRLTEEEEEGKAEVPSAGEPSSMAEKPTRESAAERRKALEREQLKQIEQMHEYFSQYIEEYEEVLSEEEVDEEKEEAPVMEKPKVSALLRDRNLRHIDLLTPEEVVEFLREQRAKNIVCIRAPPQVGSHHFVIICSPHNVRHASAITINVRRFIKHRYHYPDYLMPKKDFDIYGWYTLNMGRIGLHVMTEGCRNKYDIDSLNGIGWGAEEQALEELSSASYLPPSQSETEPSGVNESETHQTQSIGAVEEVMSSRS